MNYTDPFGLDTAKPKVKELPPVTVTGQRVPVLTATGLTFIYLGESRYHLKPVAALGSKPGSSYASVYLSKKIPQTFTKVLGTKTGTTVATTVGTNVIGRFFGRLVPYVGWGLLVKDAYDNRKAIGEFIGEMRKINEANKDNPLWHVR